MTWKNEKQRHSEARRGIKTNKSSNFLIKHIGKINESQFIKLFMNDYNLSYIESVTLLEIYVKNNYFDRKMNIFGIVYYTPTDKYFYEIKNEIYGLTELTEKFIKNKSIYIKKQYMWV